MKSAPGSPEPTRGRVRRYRAKLREQGLRPVQVWVPDTRTPDFPGEARRQSLLVAGSEYAEDDQAFIDAIGELDAG